MGLRQRKDAGLDAVEAPDKPGVVRVLHVVEAYGGGLASALDEYVRSTPEFEHHLIHRQRVIGNHADDGERARFATVTDLGPGVLPAIRSIASRVRELSPHVVHAHSSYGGAFARLAVRANARAKLIYTAHCYATERRDVSLPVRLGYAAVERALARRTDVVAGCSPREVELGRRFAPGAEHVWLPNIAAVASRPEVTPAREDVPVVAGGGRLCAQRDPDFFVDVVEHLRASGLQFRALWVGGGGDTSRAAPLIRAGIELTGWLPRSEALAQLGAADVYVHSAGWDGAAMTLLESVALGVPTVSRRSAAVSGPVSCTSPRAADVADLVRGVLAGGEQGMAENLQAWRSEFRSNTGEYQRQVLRALYQPLGASVARG